MVGLIFLMCQLHEVSVVISRSRCGSKHCVSGHDIKITF